jgi:hypothetical protein
MPSKVRSPGLAGPGLVTDSRPPLPALLACLLYGMAAVAISVWAVLLPLSRRWGLAGHLALFVPLVAYASSLAVASMRLRPKPDGASAPTVLVYGLLLLHAAIGAAGGTTLALFAARGNPRGIEVPAWADALAGATFPAMLLGWLPPLPLRLGVGRSGMLLLIGLLGCAWLLLWGMQLGMDIF